MSAKPLVSRLLGQVVKISAWQDKQTFSSLWFDKTPVRLHLFICNNLKEDVLISAEHLKALGLIPQAWPECMDPRSKHYSRNYTAATAALVAAEEEAKEEEPEVKPEASVARTEIKNETPPPSIPRARVNLNEELWSDPGEVLDIPHINDFPDSTRAILYKYGDVFKNFLKQSKKN